MTFLAIIIALVMLQVWGSGGPVQHDGWFLRWQVRVAGWALSPAISLALLVLLPVALAGFILDALEPVLFGLLWIALAVYLLLYAFGRGDFHALMARYRSQCQSGDFEAAYLTARTEFAWPPPSKGPASPQEVDRFVQRALLYEGYQRWFAVLFYFLLLGPAGALAYRLLHLCRQTFEPELTERCLFLADWVPARLLAAAFSLAGDFVGSADKLLAALPDTSLDTSELLYTVGVAALGDESAEPAADEDFRDRASARNREFAGLLSRSAVCWVALVALLVLLS